LLSGCTVGPNFEPPAPPPVAGYLPRDGRPQLAPPKVVVGEIPYRWWELFRSKALSRLIEEGFAHNPDIQSAEAAVRVAQANSRVARGALFPQVEGSFNPTRQMISNNANTSDVPSGARTYSVITAQLTVTYVADVFGGTRRKIEATDSVTEAQEFQREAAYLTLAANIALAAVQEMSLRGQISATTKIIGTQTRLLDVLRKQNQAGQIAEPDVAAQETALAQAKILLPALQKQLDVQRHTLAVLTGRLPSHGIGAEFELGSIRLPHTIPVSLPADLILQRPDVRVAQANMRQANAEIGVALANRLPQISLSGNLGNSAVAMSQLFSPQTGLWMVAGNVLQPIFSAGTLLNKQIAAEENFAQVEAQYRSVVLTAFQNVADSLRALQADTRALAAARDAERAAERSFELTRRQIERGQSSVQLLLTTQQAFLQTSIARVQAEAQLLTDTILLFQSLGGGWWNRPAETSLVTENKS
jgi:NodT family efflux transporter outer membrane factor (OMF) lipoprotein